jgi:hypothetical protein
MLSLLHLGAGEGNRTFVSLAADFLDGIGPVANQRLEAVTSEHVLRHREQLESEDRAPATVNFTVKRVLKRAFKAAIDEGIITRNPRATVRLIQDRDKADKHVFSPEQVSKLIGFGASGS